MKNIEFTVTLSLYDVLVNSTRYREDVTATTV